MTTAKHSKMGERLIPAMKEGVDCFKGKTVLQLRHVEVPERIVRPRI